MATGLDKKIDDLTQEVSRLSRNFEQYIQHRAVASDGAANGNVAIRDAEEVDDYKQDFSKDENEERGNWSGRLDFLLACLGYAVGLGNVWRFPYLCYKNGGAIFFVPYIIMLFLVGMPIFLLELALGQYTSSGPLTCWNMANIFRGVGVGMVIVSFYVGIYYNMIIGWAFYYLFASFTSDLPWQYCDREWNTEFCSTLLNNVGNASHCQDILMLNASVNGVCYNGTTAYGIFNETLAASYDIKKVLPTQEYLERYVWKKHLAPEGMDTMGPMDWRLVLCLLLSWIVVCLCLIRGIKSSGKVVYFTALFPYAVLVILLIRGVTLDGHMEGIRFYIMETDVSKLANAQVWKDAAVQIFFSLSASWGGLIALSSYNRFHNDVFRDAMIVSLGNCLTSFFAGFVIFSFMGFLAHETGQRVEDIADDGVGLAFIVYPDAVTRLPISPLWAILFFIMLITLGLDSEFALVETVTTAIMDQFPSLRPKKSLVIVLYGVVLFILGLPLCTAAGSDWLEMCDTYAGGWNVMVIALCECICIGYIYGVFNFREDVATMLGDTGCGCVPWRIVFWWWMICWCFLTPVGVIFIMVFSWVDYSPMDEDFPHWADILGWLMTMTVVAAIFVVALIQLIYYSRERGLSGAFKYLVQPNKYWGPALPRHRRLVRHLPNMEIDPTQEEVDFQYQSNKGFEPSINKGFDPDDKGWMLPRKRGLISYGIPSG